MDERRQVTSEVRLRGRSSFPRSPSPLPGQCATRLRAEPTSVLCRAPRAPITSLLAAQHRLVPPSAGSSPGPPSRRTARPQEPADTRYRSRKPRSSRTSPAKPPRPVRRLCLSRRVGPRSPSADPAPVCLQPSANAPARRAPTTSTDLADSPSSARTRRSTRLRIPIPSPPTSPSSTRPIAVHRPPRPARRAP